MCNYTPTLKVEKGLIKYPSTVLFSPPHVLVLPALLQFPPHLPPPLGILAPTLSKIQGC